MNKYNEKLMDRTCAIIRRGGRLLLKNAGGGYYLHHHTNIAAGFGSAVWGRRHAALEIDTLELAFLLAPFFECKVVAVYPKSRAP